MLRGTDNDLWLTRVSVYGFSGGRSTRVAELQPHLGLWSGTAPAISPDGPDLLFTRYAMETSDLVLVENLR